MIGRGALSVPNLSRVVKDQAPLMSWPQFVGLLQKYSSMEKQGDTSLYHVSRIKQWLNYLRKHYPEAGELFSTHAARAENLFGDRLCAQPPFRPSAMTFCRRQTPLS